MAKQKIIKVTEHFHLAELVHPAILAVFGRKSIMYLNPRLVAMLEFIRCQVGYPIYVNGWYKGKLFTESGLRDYFNFYLKRKSKSRHYYGLCFDLKCDNIEHLQLWIYDNSEMLREMFGLSVIEDFEHTPTWCHISVEWRKNNKVKIMVP